MELLTHPTHNQFRSCSSSSTRNPSDPLPKAPEPIRPEVKINEVDKAIPPPYHIAASMSKHAGDFHALERKNSVNSVTESETSTAPSSLQTIVRSPYTASETPPSVVVPPQLVKQSSIPVLHSRIASVKKSSDKQVLLLSSLKLLQQHYDKYNFIFRITRLWRIMRTTPTT